MRLIMKGYIQKNTVYFENACRAILKKIDYKCV